MSMPLATNRCNPGDPGGCNVCAKCCQAYIPDGPVCDGCVSTQCPAPGPGPAPTPSPTPAGPITYIIGGKTDSGEPTDKVTTLSGCPGTSMPGKRAYHTVAGLGTPGLHHDPELLHDDFKNQPLFAAGGSTSGDPSSGLGAQGQFWYNPTTGPAPIFAPSPEPTPEPVKEEEA